MKTQGDFRDPEKVRHLLDAIAQKTSKNWSIMEICGGQTHVFLKYGLDQLLPSQIDLLHGPGCPVCVTAAEFIDMAIQIARQPDTLVVSFGDMLRVPGSCLDLLSARAEGAAVQMVYSPLDALEIAQKEPKRQVVFFAVGFETTAPAIALTIVNAQRNQISNFSVLCAHVRVPPAMTALLSNPAHRIDGFLAAGHVCTVMGSNEYYEIAKKFSVPIVITGFEPLDILYGVYRCIVRLEDKQPGVENAYARVTREQGNATAQQILQQVFQVVDRNWRGLGLIPLGGFQIREEYGQFDALRRFSHFSPVSVAAEDLCMGGKVLQGLMKPDQCPYFATRCSPEHPLGAPMVSSEGACAAYYRYRRNE
ncbi:MAG TPA: hydrogenase formation protein HypD [bacterium]|nr:hydrogenase formation protein HypD [bacterium]